MVPDYRVADIERTSSQTAATALQVTEAATVSADGSEETLFDFEESRDYDLGVGD